MRQGPQAALCTASCSHLRLVLPICPTGFPPVHAALQECACPVEGRLRWPRGGSAGSCCVERGLRHSSCRAGCGGAYCSYGHSLPHGPRPCHSCVCGAAGDTAVPPARGEPLLLVLAACCLLSWSEASSALAVIAQLMRARLGQLFTALLLHQPANLDILSLAAVARVRRHKSRGGHAYARSNV